MIKQVFIGIILFTLLLNHANALDKGVDTLAVQAGNVSLGFQITNASAVRLRAADNTGSQTVAILPLGEVLTVLGKGQTAIIAGQKNSWYQVRRSNGQSGFIFGSLLTEYDPDNPLEGVLTITENRLAKSDLSLQEAFDLYQFLEKAEQSANPLDQGVIAELRLKSLARYAEILSKVSNYAPTENLPKELKESIYYHELAGGYFVRPETYWQAAERYANSQSGDNLAFAAAIAIYPGECEGEPFCVLMRFTDTGGRYLKNYPRGQHVDAVVNTLKEGLPNDQAIKETIAYFINNNEYANLTLLENAIKTLQVQVERSGSRKKGELLQQLLALEKLF